MMIYITLFSYSMSFDVYQDDYTAIAHPHEYIYIDDLYQSYSYICITKGLIPLSKEMVTHHLKSIVYKDHTDTTFHLINYLSIKDSHERVNIISRTKYNRFKYITNTYKKYRQFANVPFVNVPILRLTSSSLSSYKKDLIADTPNHNRSMNRIFIVIQITELIIVSKLIYDLSATLPYRLLIAKTGAILILYNSMLLLIHISGLINSITFPFMNLAIHNSLQSIDSSLHLLFGIKITIGTMIHVIAHLLHIDNILRLCVNGCARNIIITIPQDGALSSPPLSWMYFATLYPYYSGLVLTAILVLLLFSLYLKRINKIRISIFYNWHRSFAIVFFAITILHGIDQYMGFNLSYVFILPTLLLYLITRRMELLCSQKLEIDAWHISSTMIRIFFLNTDYINRKLKKGITISTFINHPATSLFEWHPFTLSSVSRDPSRSYISIKKSGKWTRSFVENVSIASRSQFIQYVNVGHTSLSCFRFYTYYNRKIYFCSGIGITPFLSIIEKPGEITSQLTLIWSVNDIDLIHEFGNVINRISNFIQRPGVTSSYATTKVYIFYSNSSKKINQPISDLQMHKLNYLQTLIHFKTGIDIILGFQMPIITILERADPVAILTNYINDQTYASGTIGVFTCGNQKYCDSIKNAFDTVSEFSDAKLDLWVEST